MVGGVCGEERRGVEEMGRGCVWRVTRDQEGEEEELRAVVVASIDVVHRLSCLRPVNPIS